MDTHLASENKLVHMGRIFMDFLEFISFKKLNSLSFVILSKAIIKWRECFKSAKNFISRFKFHIKSLILFQENLMTLQSENSILKVGIHLRKSIVNWSQFQIVRTINLVWLKFHTEMEAKLNQFTCLMELWQLSKEH